MTQAPSTGSTRRRAWRWIAICVGAWLAIVTVLFICLRATGETRRADALERLRASGAAVLPQDLPPRPIRGGSAPTAWLARVSASGSGNMVFDEPYAIGAARVFVTPSSLRTMTSMFHRPQLCGTSELTSEPCKAWLAELSNDHDEFQAAILAALADPAALAARRECLIEVLVRTWKLDDGADRGLDACSVAQFELARMLEDAERTAEPVVSRVDVSSVVRRLAAAAHVAALRGDGASAVSALEAALCAASLPAELPMAYLEWSQAVCDALDGIAECVSMLPGTADMSRLLAILDELAPRERYLRALEGQRAFGNRLFARIEDGRADATQDEPLLGPLVHRAWGGHDQAIYLEEFERLLETAARTPAENRAAAPVLDSSLTSPVARVALQSSVQGLTRWAEVQARIELCRIAMIARADGAEAALAACAAAVDPFDDAPIRGRAESDGTLTLWSVGENGLDERAARPPVTPYGWTEPPDIVVRVLLP